MTTQSLKKTIERFLPCISKEPWESFVSQHPSVLPGDRLVGVASAGNCLIYTAKLDAGCSEETHRRQMADAQWNAFARTALPQLLRIAEELDAKLKVCREALEAREKANELMNRANEHSEEAEACGYSNDPTGSGHVTDSYRRANDALERSDVLLTAALAEIRK